MTICLGKSCSFDLPRVPFVNCCQFMYMYLVFPFGFAGRNWDLIVSVPDHCLSFYFLEQILNTSRLQGVQKNCAPFHIVSIFSIFLQP